MTEELNQPQPSNPTDAEPSAPADQPQDAPAASSGDDAAAEQQKSNAVQKRIDELTRLRREAEREAAYWQGQATANQRQQQQQPQQPPAEDQPPQATQYQNYEDFTRAVAQFEARKEARVLVQQEQARLNQARQQQEYVAKFENAKQKIATEGAAKYQDFQEVVTSPDLRISTVMVEAMGQTKNPADIAYHLGKNPAEAFRISQLHPIQQAIEIGRLEGRLATPSQKTITQAPEPVETVGTRRGGSSRETDLEKASMDDYIAQRRKQGAHFR